MSKLFKKPTPPAPPTALSAPGSAPPSKEDELKQSVAMERSLTKRAKQKTGASTTMLSGSPGGLG